MKVTWATVHSPEDAVQREHAGGGIVHHCIDNDDCMRFLESVCHRDEWKYCIDEVEVKSMIKDRRSQNRHGFTSYHLHFHIVELRRSAQIKEAAERAANDEHGIYRESSATRRK
jgi:hypothetical protein